MCGQQNGGDAVFCCNFASVVDRDRGGHGRVVSKLIFLIDFFFFGYLIKDFIYCFFFFFFGLFVYFEYFLILLDCIICCCYHIRHTFHLILRLHWLQVANPLHDQRQKYEEFIF